MSQLCFATFARALQKVLIQPVPKYNTPTGPGSKKASVARPRMTSTDAHVVEVLLRWIQDATPVVDTTGWDVWRTSKTVSGLLNQKIELHTGFGQALNDPAVFHASFKAFAEIKRDILPMRKDDFTAELVELIKDDPTVSAKATQKLLESAQEGDEKFWAMTFMSSISRPNVKRHDVDLTDADVLLAARNQDLCPLCHKERLVKTVKSQQVKQFEIVSFPLDDQGKQTAKEALCLKCAKLISSQPSLFNDTGLLDDLRAIQERKRAAAGLQDVALESQLHPVIMRVIENLGEKLLNGSASELTFEAIPVAKKFQPEYYELSQRVKILVLQWYRIVEHEFSELEDKKRNRFTVIASQIADFYESASQLTNDQQAIFDAVVNWIDINSDSTSRDASTIVAAFFVQNCEVFDEVA